ncbi:MAG: DUF6020 family protein [Clostridia bacterium]|nr:DUF6020 family protein [Clostridia bacterium]
MVNKNLIKNVGIIVLSLITVLSFCCSNEVISMVPSIMNYQNNVIFLNYVFIKFEYAFQNAFGIIPFILTIVFSYFYYETNKKEVEKKAKRYSLIISILFSLTMLIGNSLMQRNDMSLVIYDTFQVLISVIKLIGYGAILYYLFIYLFYILDNKSIHVGKPNQENGKFDKHPVVYTMIMILVLYIPYIVFFFPGSMNLDSLFQINQFYGTAEWNTQHPIISTIVYGAFMKIGTMLKNPNLGLFIPNILQLILCVTIISNMINYFYHLTNNKRIRACLILFFGLVPVWPINFYTEVKDIPFSIAILGMMFLLMKSFLSKENLEKKDYILWTLSLLVTLFFRHNGMHTIILSIPFIWLMIKNNKEKKAIILICIIAVVFSYTMNMILMSCLHISKGSKKEVLSVPLQQTASYVYFRNNELTKDEIETIDKIIEIDKVIENYDPETIDYVKAYYKEPSNEELMEYFKVWFKMFFKHPDTYILATLNMNFGYIYPEWKEYRDGIALYEITYSDTLDKNDLDLHYLDIFKNQRNTLEDLAYGSRSLPFGLIYSCGTYFWLLIMATIILWYYGKRREILPLIPLYTIILATLVSPINAYVRYFVPLMVCMPFIVCYTILTIFKKQAD